MNPEQMIADLESKAQQLRQRSEQMQEQIQHASSTITSPNEAVTVRVAPNGPCNTSSSRRQRRASRTSS